MEAKNLYKELSDDSKQVLGGLANDIKDEDPEGRVILFLGAAANYNAPKGYESVYSNTDRPPVGKELNNMFIDEIWPPDDFSKKNAATKAERWPLSYTTQFYEADRDRRRLMLSLNKFIGDKKPSPILKALAEMPFKYIITTNYDQLFETALREVGKGDFFKGGYQANRGSIAKPTYEPDGVVSINRPFLYKLHGDLDETIKVNGAKNEYIEENDSIVLTDEDYLHFILRMGQLSNNLEKNVNEKPMNMYPIPELINEAFTGKNQNTFLFIGYGLQDYNLRLIFKIALWKKDENLFKKLQKWSISLNQHKPIQEFFTKEYSFRFVDHDIWCAVPYLYKKIFNREMPLQ